jgi:hypothetical protein
MYDAVGGAPQPVALTLYTDAFLVRGLVQTRQRRITDILNLADDAFLILSDVTFDEFGSRGTPIHSEFAQINLGSVLFVVSDEPVEAVPELRTPKQAEQAIISTPPFKVVGQIHLLPERSLRNALSELHGQFIPVTDATFWSDSLGEARASYALVAVNHSRSQILAPHREIDPWAGLGPATASAAASEGPVERPEVTGWESATDALTEAGGTTPGSTDGEPTGW